MLRQLGVVVLLGWMGVLAACGGGGGSDVGGSVTTPSGSFSMQFATSSVETTMVEGETGQVGFQTFVSNQTNRNVYLYLVEAKASGYIDYEKSTYDGSTGKIVFKTLGEGTYSLELMLRACLDDACSNEVAAPIRLQVKLRVLPGIRITGQTVFERTGREPAPSSTLSMSIPAEVGEVEVFASLNDGPFRLIRDGDQLQITTQQARAGVYRAQFVVQGRYQYRYRTTLDLTYTVHAPPEGESPLTITLASENVYLAQGETTSRRFKLTGPTWTDHPVEVPAIPAGGPFSLVSLGNDEYELVIDAKGRTTGQYNTLVTASAGPTAESVTRSVSLEVNAGILMPVPLQTTLTLSSDSSSLHMATPVQTPDGAQVRWTATTDSPWLKLVRASGITGVDALEVDVDASQLSSLPAFPSAELTVAVDRPGVPSRVLPVGISNRIPRLERTNTPVAVGPRFRLWIDGVIPLLYQNLANSGALKVDGATLVNATIVTDSRFVGEMAVLWVDVEGAVPGRDVVVRIDTPLTTSQVRVAVEAAAALPSGYAALPYGVYRPPYYLAGQGSVSFATPGALFRWSRDSGDWQLQRRDIPGLIDAAPSQDEARLYGITSTEVLALDSRSLLEQGRSKLWFNPVFYSSAADFDANVDPRWNAIGFAADFRAFASETSTVFGERYAGVGWLGSRAANDLLDLPRWADPGTTLSSGPPVGIIRSPSGQRLLKVYQQGFYSVYDAATRTLTSRLPLPDGVRPVAVSELSERVIGSDGWLYMGSELISRLRMANLAGFLPADRVAGGYALSGDARFALVYGYRVAAEAGGERARDAAIWVIDVTPTGVGGRLVATVALPDAVGCTEPLVSGESCRHEASVLVTEGLGSVFVLGPRGVAVVALPDVGQSAALTAAVRARASGGVSSGLNRPVRLAPAGVVR